MTGAFAVEYGTGIVCVRVRRGWVRADHWMACSWSLWGMLRWAWIQYGWPRTIGSDRTMIVCREERSPTLTVWTFADGRTMDITHAPPDSGQYRVVGVRLG